jgi:CRISPR-associated exonuclease Cas4
MYDEDDLLPISGLQHLLFCPRQCALIHLEQAWAENRLTAQGRQMHDRLHEGLSESRGDVRIIRGLRLQSRALRLTGQADVVELHRAGPEAPPQQHATFPGLDGAWSVCPVEYKHGRPKQNNCDRVQLCAQALCLEEMIGVSIPQGALYYGRPRRRETVIFDAALRQEVHDVAHRLHALICSGITPPAEYSRACRSCSLEDLCMPKSAGRCRSARNYLPRQLQASLNTPAPEGPHEDP